MATAHPDSDGLLVQVYRRSKCLGPSVQPKQGRRTHAKHSQEYWRGEGREQEVEDGFHAAVSWLRRWVWSDSTRKSSFRMLIKGRANDFMINMNDSLLRIRSLFRISPLLWCVFRVIILLNKALISHQLRHQESCPPTPVECPPKVRRPQILSLPCLTQACHLQPLILHFYIFTPVDKEA